MTCSWLCLLVACNSACHEAPSAPPAPPPSAARNEKPTAAEAPKLADDAAAAADVVRRYYAAIAERDYKTAYAQWGDDGKASRQSFERFQAGFTDTRTTSVEVEQPGDVEGAAGSLYITIPVTVHAELNDGASQKFTGSYVLRRVNNVDGSSAEQRRWHLSSASLQAVK